MKPPEHVVLSIPTIREIAEIVEDFCGGDFRETLVVFDVDQTLLKPADDITSYQDTSECSEFLRPLLQQLTIEQLEEIFNLAVVDSEQVFMEPETSDFVQELGQKGARVIALTASLVGRLQQYERFEFFRYQTFVDMGLRFSENMCSESSFEFRDLAAFRGYYPVFHYGVLFGNGVRGSNSKGELLSSFLKKCVTMPKNIVFIDDWVVHVNSVAEALKSTDINFLSIEYTKSQENNLPSVSFSDFQKRWTELFKNVTRPNVLE